MHRHLGGARRWARLLGAAVLGGALSVGFVAALPADAATYGSSAPRVTFDFDPGNFSEEGTYSDPGSGSAEDGQANSVGNGDRANSVGNGDQANSVSNGDRANSVSHGDRANSVANSV